MADQGQQGSMAGAHEAQPIISGMPVEVATTTAPKSETLFGGPPSGIGCSRKGAH